MFGLGAHTMVDPRTALAGRPYPIPDLPDRNAVTGLSLQGPWTLDDGTDAAVLHLAFGCFWGAERIMWSRPGVITTAVGYMGGYTPHPTYEEVCTGRTGHTESVLVAYDPAVTGPEMLLKAFWENHDPTQGMRQGHDVGTQYRSAVYWTTPEQEQAARETYDAFRAVLRETGSAQPITTELLPAGGDRREDETVAGPFYFAEEYHQQYLHKNPNGYCMHGPNGLSCPIGGR
ncbi:peptide-methionine (S)-S-oxide reductase [Austwickia chelonae]|uniref:Peptide methionine sulfoxide reductase MsrA n=1 Tax=Austwickia chelonae NBRC 105200 TaxID=1184607 RepID=K6V746_9MICO|nr:peptide-methionine (S)-S-oxide reductase MsrA [Austwickia chelonae]GAB78023.1 peptide methionine sulfoxide reductase MsrA [Austwickia chelonae NBRC 105200]SEV94539.1 peptide-methionine (S)-S-oxide reductase [Austwickia chelonae]